MNNNTKAKRRRMNLKSSSGSVSTAKNIRMTVTASGTRHLPLDENRRHYRRTFPTPPRS